MSGWFPTILGCQIVFKCSIQKREVCLIILSCVSLSMARTLSGSQLPVLCTTVVGLSSVLSVNTALGPKQTPRTGVSALSPSSLNDS